MMSEISLHVKEKCEKNSLLSKVFYIYYHNLYYVRDDDVGSSWRIFDHSSVRHRMLRMTDFVIYSAKSGYRREPGIRAVCELIQHSLCTAVPTIHSLYYYFLSYWCLIYTPLLMVERFFPGRQTVQ